MRLLVACLACHRQYDASGYRVGSRFHCHCGQVVTVEQPPAHEAAVVRCSGCGAPRSPGSNCVHCGSSFAVYERDLTSVCPHCMTRISDQARFCHSCGVAVAVDAVAGELTELVCPACGGEQRMHSRKLGRELSMLECSGCAGLWLGPHAFQHMIRRAEELAADIEAPSRAQRPTAGISMFVPIRYRPCPVCASLMNRSQYGKFSRVIVDSCKPHGVWLDEGELEQILEWVRGGGLDRSRRTMHEERLQALRDKRCGSTVSKHSEGFRHGSDSGGGEIELGESLFLRLFS